MITKRSESNLPHFEAMWTVDMLIIYIMWKVHCFSKIINDILEGFKRWDDGRGIKGNAVELGYRLQRLQSHYMGVSYDLGACNYDYGTRTTCPSEERLTISLV